MNLLNWTKDICARRMGADIFVSIHADGFTLSRVKGASVYIWSKKLPHL